MNKKLHLLLGAAFISQMVNAQETLQTVTDRGQYTTPGKEIQFKTLDLQNRYLFLGGGTNYPRIGAYNVQTGSYDNVIFDCRNIGLGTASPTEKLDVNGNVVWNGYRAGNARALKLGYSGGNYGGIGYNIDFTTTTGLFNRPLNDQSSYLEFTYGGFRFFGNPSPVSANNITLGGGENNMNLLATITREGKFGIGTATPAEKLTVENGNIKINSRYAYLLNFGSLSETVNGASTILGNNVVAGSQSNTIKRNFHSIDNGSFVSLNYLWGITFHTGINSTINTDVPQQDSEKMRITQGGDVGIGTATPGEKLTVENGNIKINPRYAYLLNYGSLSETVNGASTILGNNVVAGSQTNTVKRNVHSIDNGSFVSLNYSYGITFHTGINSTINTDVPQQDSEKMRITQGGDVGIGTASPQEKLSVNGKIRAKEVKVEATNWPDYVFEDGYRRKSLTELEQYIKQYKHLPDVPTAKDVEDNGVALGEMNRILLKKVEELTLHLIEKDKQISELQSITKKLAERMELLDK